MSVRYESLDKDLVSFKLTRLSKTLILREEHNLSLANLENESSVASLSMFIREAVVLTPSKLPEECWEFASSIKDGKPKSPKKYRSRDDIKKAITTHAIASNNLCRKYNPHLVTQELDKGEWKPIPDSLYEELHLEKNDIIHAEKKWNKYISIILGAVVLLLIGGVFFGLWFLSSNIQIQLTPAEWGRLIGTIVGVIVGSVVMFRIHPVLGIITLIAGLAYGIKPLLR